MLKTNIEDLNGFTAVLNIGGVVKSFEDLTARKLSFNLTAEETAAMSLGFIPVEIIFTDPQGRKFKGLGDTIFEVRAMEDFTNEE